MNETVKRIVEILFQDTEMTEEVQAMRDELMDNCQQRYEDLVAQGRSEDEAIALVGGEPQGHGRSHWRLSAVKKCSVPCPGNG